MSFAADTAGMFLGPLSEPALYTPEGGSAQEIRVIPRRADADTRFGSTAIRSEAASFLVQVADVERPDRGDRIDVLDADGAVVSSHIVQAPGQRDRNRLYSIVDAHQA